MGYGFMIKRVRVRFRVRFRVKLRVRIRVRVGIRVRVRIRVSPDLKVTSRRARGLNLHRDRHRVGRSRWG